MAARILNATLVIPKLDENSFWKDSRFAKPICSYKFDHKLHISRLSHMIDDDFCSDFGEIFNVGWFISSLSKDVKIVRQLPKKGGKIAGNPYRMRVPRKCTPKCYQNRVLPALLKKLVWPVYYLVYENESEM